VENVENNKLINFPGHGNVFVIYKIRILEMSWKDLACKKHSLRTKKHMPKYFACRRKLQL